MACFTAPLIETVVVGAAKKGVEKKEKKEGKTSDNKEEVKKISLSRKLSWLTRLLCGGSVLLAFEHVWHGEIVPWFPFLTAMNDPEDAAEMFNEIATVGVSMAVLITLVWIGMCVAADIIVKRSSVEDVKKANA